MKERLLEVVSIDCRSLALFRIGLGAVILGDLARRALDLTAHYTDAGVLPRNALVAEVESGLPWAGSLLELTPHFWFGGTVGQGALFAVAAALALALALGWRTRIVCLLSWVLLASLHGRNPAVLNFGDVVLRLLLCWSIWLPLGARWSLDRRRQGSSAGSVPGRVVGGATAALLLQVASIYVFNALLKRSPAWTEDFTALELAFRNEVWTAPLGTLLLAYPTLLRALTAAVLWLERLGPLIAFSPVWNGPMRLLAAVCFGAFHLGVLLTTNLGVFPWICIVAWCAFLPSGVWDRWSARRAADGSTPAGGGRLRLGRVASVVTLGLLGLVLVWNVATLPASTISLPRPAVGLVYALRLDQRWAMFAPGPPEANVWQTAESWTAAGERVAPMGGTPGAGELAKPMPPFDRLRWRLYLRYALGRGEKSAMPALLARYLARRWDDGRGESERLATVRLLSVSEPIATSVERREPDSKRAAGGRVRQVYPPPAFERR